VTLQCVPPYSSPATPEVEVTVTLNEPLYATAEQALDANCITIAVQGAYSLPQNIGIPETDSRLFLFSQFLFSVLMILFAFNINRFV